MAKSKKKKKNKGGDGEESAAKRWAKNKKKPFVNTVYDAPEGMSFFKLKGEGSKRIDIIPFEAGRNNPNSDEGIMTFERTFYQHNNIGPSKGQFLCPTKTSNNPCPICEYLSKEDDKDLWSDIGPKERQLFMLFDQSDPEKGVQIWDVSTFLFGNLLAKLVEDADDDDDYLWFYHPKKGKSLKIGFTEQAIGKNKFSSVDTIQFKDRSNLDKSILSQAICLDKLLIERSYDDLRDLFHAVDDNDGGGKSQGKKKDKKKKDKKNKNNIPF